MVKENNLTNKTPVDDNDFVRGVSEEGESVKVLNSTLKTYIGEGTATPFIEVVGTGDDRGLICTEQWSVGKPGASKESVFGEGDSYGVGKEDTTPEGTPKPGSAWHCDMANTSGSTITSATDITETLSSDTGSTTSLFGGTTTGKYLLVGSDYTYGGFKAKINTLGVVEPLNVVGEFLASVGVWQNAPFMVTNADSPYQQKGNQIATCGSCSEQWRFGFHPLVDPTPWDKVPLTINGVEYTKYWGRFRITSNITSDPIMEQIKMHTSRFEVNANGVIEHFGRTRFPKTILIEKHTNALKNPANQNVAISTDMTEIRDNNNFVNGKDDGFILSGIIPKGLDTSIPVQVIIDWYPNGTGTGDVELSLSTIGVTPGFVYDGTAISNVQTPQVTSINNEEGVLQRNIFVVDVSTRLPGDKIYGSLHRNALGNPADTYADRITIVGFQVVGYFWRS